MYRQEKRTEFDPNYRRRSPVFERRRAELVIEPREAPIPGQELRSTITLASGDGRLDFILIACAAALLLLVVGAVHGRAAVALALGWLKEPSFSYALVAPVFAAYLLWFRRDERPMSWQGSWWGLAIVLLGGGADVAADWGYYYSVRPVALLLTLSGLCVLAGGRAAWHWCWPAMMSLAFALPLPARLLAECSPPIQRWTAAASAYLLVTLGFPAVSAGSELVLGDSRMGITDAWSGLGSFAACLAVSSAVALLVEARFWERSLIVLSAVPIALVCNVVRLTSAAALQESVGLAAGHFLFGDAGSWLMISLALILLWIERKIISRTLVPVCVRGPSGLPRDGVRI